MDEALEKRNNPKFDYVNRIPPNSVFFDIFSGWDLLKPL